MTDPGIRSDLFLNARLSIPFSGFYSEWINNHSIFKLLILIPNQKNFDIKSQL